MKNKCECDGPGFCSRFGYRVSIAQWKWCRGELNVSKEIEDKFIEYSKPKIKKTNLIKLVLKFLVSLVQYMQSGFANVSDEEYKRRGLICMRCPYVQFKNKIISCGICDCNLKVKAKWAIMDCPKDYWKNSKYPLPVITPETILSRGNKGCGCG